MLPVAVAAAAAVAAPSSMRAVHVSGHCNDPFTCITPKTIPTPQPRQGQILIKVLGSSVNPCASDSVMGNPGCGPNSAGTPGADVAGTVVTCSGCTRLKVGDEVWADRWEIGGGMAEYAVATEAQTGLKPSNLSFVEAGTIPCVGGTILQAIQKLGGPWDKSKNLTVVITSGSGGTGYLGIQIAKAYHAGRIITATTGADNIAWMKALGADEVVDFKQKEITTALADDSVDIFLDNYGAKGTADKAMPKIRSGGKYLVIPGGNGGRPSSHPKAGVTQVSFTDVEDTNAASLNTLKKMFEDGKLKPHVQKVYSIDDGAKAFSVVAGGMVNGKVSVSPAPP